MRHGLPKVGQEAAVDNFSAKLLRGLDYDNVNRIIFIRHAIPFLICGENSVSQTDICILDDNEILLLLQVDENLTSMKDPEPQIIAEAIAAFALNNQKRECDLYLPLCDSIMFPYLTIAVQTGTFPEIETHFFCYIPALPCRNSEGMCPLLNRLEILQCLEAFKRFLGN